MTHNGSTGVCTSAGLRRPAGAGRVGSAGVRRASTEWRARAPGSAASGDRALAEGTDPEFDPDRRAWHSAHATAMADDRVAADLERSADVARARGGIAAAAFLARAAELTAEPALRGRRAVAAAQAAFEAGAPRATDDLLVLAEQSRLDDMNRAALVRLRAQIVFARRRGREATPLLLDAAESWLRSTPQPRGTPISKHSERRSTQGASALIPAWWKSPPLLSPRHLRPHLCGQPICCWTLRR
jgi:hypothetical protein